jgi:uncharacterized protein YfaP (DUF2135 family)
MYSWWSLFDLASPLFFALAVLLDYGREEAISVEGMAKADVARQLEGLVKKGESMPRSTESDGDLAK